MRFQVAIRGDQYIIIDNWTGKRIGLAHGTRKSAERYLDALEQDLAQPEGSEEREAALRVVEV